MGRKSAPTKFKRRNEMELLKAASEALPSDFPNPERLNCPAASTLEAIAVRRLPLPEIDNIVDHIATCSPCFAAYNAYRKGYRARHNWRRFGAAAVVLTLVIAGWYFGHNVLPPTRRPPDQISEVAPLTAVLDFHDRSSERSDQGQTPRSSTESPHLRRSLLTLQMRLPLGTEDGEYSLEIRNNAGGVAAQSSGTVKWDGTSETLTARIDLRVLAPGQYTIAVRKGASSWHQYSVFVD
jgi:hypothetical protein